MKKIISFIVIVCLLGAGGFFLYGHLKGPQGPSGAALLSSDTMLYCGCDKNLMLGSALSLSDFSQDLEDCGLTEEESQAMETWLKQLRGVHFGLMDVSMIPFSLDAVAVFEGVFTSSLMEALPEHLASRFNEGVPYRSVAVHKLQIPLNIMFQLELFVTDPVQDRTLVAFSRSALQGCVDRLLDGGPSLADNPGFVELTSLPDIRKKELVSYVNMQKYFETILGLCNMVPVPSVRDGAQIVREEFRLDEWGPVVTGQSLVNTGRSVSFCKCPVDMPFYQQLEYSQPAEISCIPSGVSQAMALRVVDVTQTREQLSAFVTRLMKRVRPLMKGQQLPDDPVAMAEETIGFSFSELDSLLTGSFGFWQTITPDAPEGMAQFFAAGVQNEEAVLRFIDDKVLAPARLRSVKNDGVFALEGQSEFAWAVFDGYLLFSSDADALRVAVQEETPRLVDSPEYRELRKQLPEKISWIQYVDYAGQMETLQDIPPNLQSSFGPLFDVMKSMKLLSGGVAENGMLRSRSQFQHDISADDIRAAVSAFLQEL